MQNEHLLYTRHLHTSSYVGWTLRSPFYRLENGGTESEATSSDLFTAPPFSAARTLMQPFALSALHCKYLPTPRDFNGSGLGWGQALLLF